MGRLLHLGVLTQVCCGSGPQVCPTFGPLRVAYSWLLTVVRRRVVAVGFGRACVSVSFSLGGDRKLKTARLTDWLPPTVRCSGVRKDEEKWGKWNRPIRYSLNFSASVEGDDFLPMTSVIQVFF